MKISVRNKCSDFNSFRAAKVKSLFNAESGANFNLDAELDLPAEWSIGVIVGPSGSGKTSMGKQIFKKDMITDLSKGWPAGAPIVDAIAPKGDLNAVTAALSAVGLGDVPAWLRPFGALSNGQQFRAGLARIICERPREVVIDEFTSVVDRQIAKVGAGAFQKAWRRGNDGQRAVMLTPHYDVLDWLEPDWVYDTGKSKFLRGSLWRRPKFQLEIRKVDGSYWPSFKEHYYLDLPRPVAAEYFIGAIDGELVSHLAVSPRFDIKAYRATRLVVMPEWQGAGVGIRFLEEVCQIHLEGGGRRTAKGYATYFHTSHPQLCHALRRGKAWRQVSAVLYGGNKTKSFKSITASAKKLNTVNPVKTAGYGGHFRAVQGFKYIGRQD